MEEVIVKININRLIDLLNEEENRELFPKITEESTILTAVVGYDNIIFTIGEKEGS